MASGTSQPTTIIVGAGILGVSTAYHLAKIVQPSSITIVDQHAFPSLAADSKAAPLGASHDINKIVRADYTSPFYMKLAQEAIERWQNWDLIKPFYHKTGWVMLDEKGSNTAQRIRQNFREHGLADETKDISFEEVKSNWDGILSDIELDRFSSAYWNPGAGWAEADKAVEAMLAEAVESGVKYKQGQVVDLNLREGAASRVEGVLLADGRHMTADRVVLATGAWTSQLMSNIETKLDLAADRRIESQLRAAGVCLVTFALSEKEHARYNSSRFPVLVYGSTGEVLPPPSNGLLKFTNAASFTNLVNTKAGAMSIPNPLQRQVPENLKMETLEIVGRVAPSMLANDCKVAFWRICWDAITPEQHQLITRHPDKRLSNVFFAAGGSFHSWKFLPTIGQYAANVIEGKSNGEEKDRNWAWKTDGWSSANGGAHEKLLPMRDLKDLV